MVRDPQESKVEEGTPRLVEAKEVTAEKIKQAGKKVLTMVKWDR